MDIYINFGTGTNTASGVWAHNFFGTSLATTGLTNEALLDSAGAVTSALLSTTTFSGAAGGDTAAVDIGDWQNQVFDYYWYAGGANAPATVTISGLSDGDSYTIELAGHSGNDARDTNYTLGTTQLYDNNSSTTPTAPVVFTGTVSGGQVQFTLDLVSEWAYLNGIKLTTAPSPTYTITSIDGDNDVQAGQPNVDIVMTATTGVTSVTLGGETLTINGVS